MSLQELIQSALEDIAQQKCFDSDYDIDCEVEEQLDFIADWWEDGCYSPDELLDHLDMDAFYYQLEDFQEIYQTHNQKKQNK